MIRILFVMLLMINVTYAGGERYFIKFGSFKESDGVNHPSFDIVLHMGVK